MIFGIDYSMSSPAMTIWDDQMTMGPFCWQNVVARYLASARKYAITEDNLVGIVHDVYTSQEQRFDYISDFFACMVGPGDVVALENYAFGAKGQVFHIGENTGVLKHKLWKKGARVLTVGPTVLKKHATGKGNADKRAMNDAFVERESFDLRARLGASGEVWNPSSDIIDSFFLCDYARTLLMSGKPMQFTTP